ncbi:MAG: ATP-binding protein, partial [Candidatus Acidiferrum sp.]
FNPFVTTKKTGVGLGLSIVSKIIDGHHGTIRIEDPGNPAGNGAPGSGARFVIFFPTTGERAALETSHLVIS